MENVIRLLEMAEEFVKEARRQLSPRITPPPDAPSAPKDVRCYHPNAELCKCDSVDPCAGTKRLHHPTCPYAW